MSMITNKQAGYDAEELACKYLIDLGFEIIDRNWQNRWAEIDIIAKKSNRLYFIEVKSRVNTSQGSGLDYLTPKKLKQMAFSTQMWINEQNWSGEYQLSAISVDGKNITFVEEIY